MTLKPRSINIFATSSFPAVYFLVHVTFVTLWIGSDSCDIIDMNAFLGYWCTMLFMVVITETYITCKNIGFTCSNFPHLLAKVLLSAGFFIGISFQRAKPFKCIPHHGEHVAYIIGPVIVWTAYVLACVYGYKIINGKEPSNLKDYVNLYPSDVDHTVDDDVNIQVSGLKYFELMMRAIIRETRKKFPVSELLVHYFIISAWIGSSDCDDTNKSGFIVYMVAMLFFKFLRRASSAFRTESIVNDNERLMYAILEGIQSATMLFAIILNRAKPIKCFEKTGLSLAYAVSTPLLWFACLWSIISSYLTLRTYSPSRLEEIVKGIETKRD